METAPEVASITPGHYLKGGGLPAPSGPDQAKNFAARY